MKTIITALLILFTLNVFATDTLPKVIIDTAFIPKNATAIQPLAINFQNDSVYSFTWSVSKLSKDTSLPINILVSLLDKSGNAIYSYQLVIPKIYVTKWFDIIGIDNFIISKNKKLIKK